MPDDSEQDEEQDMFPYEEAIEHLDILYKDGDAYMSVHTIDIMNHSIIQSINDLKDEGSMTEEAAKAAFWVVYLWANLHDTIDFVAAKNAIPNTVESLTEGEQND